VINLYPDYMLLTNLQNKWSRQSTPTVGEKLSDTFRPKGALKPRIQSAVKMVQKQVGVLDAMLTKMKDRDATLFAKIVDATQSHDAGTARVLSGELAEIRKVITVLTNARIMLQQVKLRLETASDIGDTVAAIVPTIGLMKSLKMQLGKFMPGADQEITRMADMLGSMMTDTFTNDSAFESDGTTTEESESILREAAAIAEAHTDSKFPNTPSDVGAQTSASDTRYM